MLIHVEEQDLAGQDLNVPDSATCGEALAFIFPKLKNIVAAKCVCTPAFLNKKTDDDKPIVTYLDLSSRIPDNCSKLSPVYADSPEGLSIIRHSAAHVLACAVKRLFPDVKVAIGPAIENGYYYDFEKNTPFTPDDLIALEKEMAKIAQAKLPFTHQLIKKEEAIQKFKSEDEPYKEELAFSIADSEVGLYSIGEFTDLCRGPHVPDSSFTAHSKLLSTAGAYWRGNEKNKMLSRIYGTAFADKKSLAAHLQNLEEARKRDHRKIGKELSYFDFEENVAPGMVFWLPKGMLVRTILEDFWRREHLKRGYEIIQGPQLLRVETWKQSGHYENYRDNMYFCKIDEDEYGIKPMNCIGHMLIYKHDLHSYRDLPKRFFELGVVHRHEKSGVLHGLFRVRQFTQDDAHIICTPAQLENEILGVIGLIKDLMGLFEFGFQVAISTRPEKSIGTDEAWDLATAALIKAVEKAGLSYKINEGDGAFYGPKIDVELLDCLGRKWQCSTIQVDFTLPERFDLEYIDSDGEKKRPVMVHRAIMGSLERFIGILLEQFAGALPVWLAPEQARILTISQNVIETAKKIQTRLQEQGIRCGLDMRNEKLGYKVRAAQLEKIAFMLIIGDKEAESESVSVRLRNGSNNGVMTVSEVIDLIKTASREPFKPGGMSYSFA